MAVAVDRCVEWRLREPRLVPKSHDAGKAAPGSCDSRLGRRRRWRCLDRVLFGHRQERQLESLVLTSGAAAAGGVAEARAPYGDGGPWDGARERRLLKLSRQIDGLYGSDETAPTGWHLKDQLRKELRQAVRYRSHVAGLEELREVAHRVEEMRCATT